MLNLKYIRLLLIVSTLMQLSIILGNFLFDLWFLNNQSFKNLFHFSVLMHYFLLFIILRFIWKKSNIEKKKKWDKTWMIIFLGVLGMWLWIVNEKPKQSQ